MTTSDKIIYGACIAWVVLMLLIAAVCRIIIWRRRRKEIHEWAERLVRSETAKE